jgi:hypothetical protein
MSQASDGRESSWLGTHRFYFVRFAAFRLGPIRVLCFIFNLSEQGAHLIQIDLLKLVGVVPDRTAVYVFSSQADVEREFRQHMSSGLSLARMQGR